MTERTNPLFDKIEIGIGTWAWGDKLFWGYGHGYSVEDIRNVFNFGIREGIRFFDTAEVYGQGKSEEHLGQFIKESQENVIVATKFMPYPWRLNRRSLLRALKRSLIRLGLKSVSLYQIHQPMPPITPEVWMEGMAEAQQLGLIEAIGVSNYERVWMQRAHDSLNREGLQLVSNQVEYHLLNRRIEHNGVFQLCNELGIKVIAYSPLAMGVLTGKYTAENPPQGIRSRMYNRARLTEIRPLLELMQRIGANRGGKTSAQVAINWVICKGAIPIPGAKTITQMEQNAGALGWRLTEDEIRLLDEMSIRVSEQRK